MTAARPVLVVVALSLLAACGRRATREWTAADHDQEPAAGAQVAAPNPAAAAAAGDDALAEATWRSNCAVCHGALGQGDGPNAIAVKPPNLTDKGFLAARTDDQLAAVIRDGKGKMPAFPSLPPAVVSGLVRRIRAIGAK